MGVVCAVGLSFFVLRHDLTQQASDEEREAMKVAVYWNGPAVAPTGVMVENQQSVRIVDVTVRLEAGGTSVQWVNFGEVHSCTQDWFSFGAHQPQVRTDTMVVLQFRDGSGQRWQMKPGAVLNKIDEKESRRDGGAELVTAWGLKRGTAPSSGCS
ncbi:hypothetical protein [Streptomyces sp. NPDC058066]|uniref:hypothetical protein n=1 Tax=Streptomyces sp. NPDC058066 TaxID=3346323 RepID=UPI0036EF973D